MIHGALKATLRHLRRQPLAGAIGTLGLAVGLAASLLIGSYLRHETGFERFNANASRVFRLTAGAGPAAFPAPLAELMAEMPGVESVARARFSGRPLLAYGEKRFFREVYGADEKLFEVLGLPIVSGDPGGLARNHTFMISEEAARQFFGDEDPVGKTLRWDALFDLEVVGVYRRPTNTHFEYDVVVSLTTWEVETAYGQVWLSSWNNGVPHTFYVMLTPDVSPAAFPEALLRAAQAQGPQWLPDQLQQNGSLPVLRPVGDIHLVEGGLTDQVHLLWVIAGVVLFIACVNFINLTTARSAQRLREVGVRKASGAQPLQLVRQFLAESAVHVALAATMAVGLAWLFGPTYTALTGIELQLLPGVETVIWQVAVLAGVVGLGAAYPAVILSRLHPTDVFRPSQKGTSMGALVRQRLAEVQLGLAVLLTLGTAAVNQQLSFMMHTDLGLDREHVISFKVGYKGLSGKSEQIAAAMREVPGVRSVGGHINPPMFSDFVRSNELRVRRNDQVEPVELKGTAVSSSFAETMGLELIAGRTTRAGLPLDAPEVLLNETAVIALGFESAQQAVGSTLEDWGRGTPTIVGVVRDFHYQSMHETIPPMLLWSPNYDVRGWAGDRGESYGNVVVRVDAAALPDVMERLATVWRSFAPEFPFHYEFIGDVFDAKHRQEATLLTLLRWLTGLALALTGMGVFAMATIRAQQRTREIGIRKALGAGPRRILVTLTRDTAVSFLVAAVVAVPVGHWVTRWWLAAFPYHVEIDAGMVIVSVLVVLGVTAAAMAQQFLRLTRLKPADALRGE